MSEANEKNEEGVDKIFIIQRNKDKSSITYYYEKVKTVQWDDEVSFRPFPEKNQYTISFKIRSEYNLHGLRFQENTIKNRMTLEELLAIEVLKGKDFELDVLLDRLLEKRGR